MKRLVGCCLAAICVLGGRHVSAKPEVRLITLGGAVAETVAALGHEGSIIAVDTTCEWPPSLANRPRVGYLRTLSGEFVLSLNATAVIASEAAGPESVLTALQSAGVKLSLVPDANDWTGARQRMLKVGEVLDEKIKVKKLVKAVDQGLEQLRTKYAKARKPKVLFLFAHGRSPVVAGRNTAADAMIEYAGGVNVMRSFSGYHPPTAESIAAAQPDVVLTTTEVLEALGGARGVARIPGIAMTPAVRRKRVVAMDTSLLLSLGPRTSEAAEQLASLLHN